MKVLVGYLIDGKFNGIDRYLMTMLNYLQDTDIHCDFLTNHKTKELEQLLNQYHSKVYEIPSLKHPYKQYKVTKEIIEKEGYDAGYFNISEAFNSMGVLAAYKCGCRKVIAHAHSSMAGGGSHFKRNIRTMIHNFFKPMLTKWTTNRIACSTLAGNWMYASNFDVLFNAVDYNRFQFNEESRNRIRNVLHVEDKIVLGHIGDFSYTKNAGFLIDILSKLDDRYHIVFVGDGPGSTSCKEKVKEMNLDERVHFVGRKENVNEYYSAMDAFLLPSFFEGLPIVAIEAQFNGLPTFLSDTITKEVSLSNNCSHVSLEVDTWVQKLQSLSRNTINQKMKDLFSIDEQKIKIMNYFQ